MIGSCESAGRERGTERHWAHAPQCLISRKYEVSMFQVDFLSQSEKEFAALPHEDQQQIIAAVCAAANGGLAETAHDGFSVARAAGQVAVFHADSRDTVQVVLLMREDLWDAG